MDLLNPTATPQTPARINKASFSRYSVWEECPHRARLAYLDKLEAAPRPGDKEPANERGQRFHDLARDYSIGQRDDLTDEFQAQADHFQDYLETFRQAFKAGNLVAETAWFFDND